MTNHDGRERRGAALAALGAIGVITVAWWALALWPLSPAVPTWVARTRAACFQTVGDGLPGAAGWLLLIGEPLGMLGFLVLVWGTALREDLRRVMRRGYGRAALAVILLSGIAGVALVYRRVRPADAEWFSPRPATEVAAWDEALPDAPALVLTDQHGRPFSLAALRGRPVLVTFAFSHCENICPTLVHDLRLARREAARPDIAIVIVTLDPWRDTPSRLPSIATAWQLTADDRLLSGSVEEVVRRQRDWGVVISRDERTGEIGHVARAVLVDAAGRVARQVDGAWRDLPSLLRDLPKSVGP